MHWPLQLPADAVQPWERDAANALQEDHFVSGRETFLEGPIGVSENGEASRLESLSGRTAYAIYRIPCGSLQPGILTVDVNLLDRFPGDPGSDFKLAYADYGTGRWNWSGPHTDSHLHILLPESLGLSSAGNFLVMVLVDKGSSVDVMGLGLDMRRPGDLAVPAAPSGLSPSPVSGGVELQWNDVLADDLAGYRIYHANHSFINPHSAGVVQAPLLEGGNRAIIHGYYSRRYFRITAVDFNGNESAPSELAWADPLTGAGLQLSVSTPETGVKTGEQVIVTASGAELYSFDNDGDGLFELTGESSGQFSVDTSRPGIIRPLVRGTDADGNAVALGSVSLFVDGNSRPAASALADPQSGPAPLQVQFTGMADDDEDDEFSLRFAWDFNGDGIYETGTDSLEPDPQTYSQAGTYNVKFRVTDSEGLWDVDTLAVNVLPAENIAPSAEFSASATSGLTPLTVDFNASASTDDNAVVEYAWDWDEQGGFTVFNDSPLISHTFNEPGLHTVRLRTRDAQGASDIDSLLVSVFSIDNEVPVADLQASTEFGIAPLSVNFDASLSTDADGAIVEYAWDWDGNGAYDSFSDDPLVSYTFQLPGIRNVRLRVTDNEGAQATDFLQINAEAETDYSPNAQLDLSVLSGDAPLVVTLDASDSSDDGTITGYSWDWDGDGLYDSFSDVPMVQHTYVQPGAYVAIVKVTDDSGQEDTDSLGLTVNVAGNDLPVAIVTASPDGGENELWVTMDASGSFDPDGSIVLYEWDFEGDGSYESYGISTTVTHYYGQIGNYRASVRVTDDKGAQTVGGDWIAVNEEINPVHTWGNDGHDLRGTRRSKSAGPQDDNLRWTFTSGGFIGCTPAVASDGTVYFGSYDNKLYALNPDGSEKWNYATAGEISSSPALDDSGNIYFGSFDNSIYALDSSGGLLWSHPTADEIRSPALVGSDGKIYIGSFDGKLYAMTPAGSEAWTYDTGGSIWCGISEGADGNIYFGEGTDLFCLDQDGNLQWTYAGSDGIYTTPSIGADGSIHVSDLDENFYAVRPDGTLKWSVINNLSGGSGCSVGIGLDGTLFYTITSNKLLARNPDGSLDWELQLGDTGSQSVAIGNDGTMYLATFDNKVHAINRNGSIAWTYNSPTSMISSTSIGADGVIYVGGFDGKLYALGPALP
ncbi:PQQ-binding-like beta-propeller repeat protein [bacterium]|nr:PQQ-binding-like beta-propeller repeat protein [bacterium]